MNAGMVSVVIPCYRGAEYLAFAIESCVVQTYKNLEIIVVDDASPDDCAAIAQRYAASDRRIRVIRRAENGGVSRAFNTGYEASLGQYFTRLAQDDVLREDAIERMVRVLAAYPDVGLVYSDYEKIDEKGRFIACATVPNPSRALRWRNDIGLCVMWPRTVWEALGGFSSEYDTAEDFEYWLRIASRFRIARCPGGALLYVRSHGQAGSNVYYEKQHVATVRLLKWAAEAYDPSGRLQLRKALGYEAISMAREYLGKRLYARALTSAIHSCALWPIPFRSSEVGCHFSRLRVCVNAVLRSSLSARVASSRMVWKKAGEVVGLGHDVAVGRQRVGR